MAGQANPTIPAVEQASNSASNSVSNAVGIDMGKPDTGKAAAKSYGDLSSKGSQ